MAAPATTLGAIRLEKLRRLRALESLKELRAGELMRNMDVFAKIGYVPTARQAVFHEATEAEVLYGGSLGGGKSIALVAEAIRAAVKHPGIRVGVFRRSYPELEESVIAELSQKFAYAAAVGGKWNGSDRTLRFPNGSVIMFRYAESMKDATRRQGGQYQLLMVDELTLMAPDVVEFLKSRIRSGNANVPVLGFRASANPGGPGHGAVRTRYIDPTNYGEHVIVDPDTKQTIRFVKSSMLDNPHLDQGYRDRLNSLPEELRKAFRDGDWGVFAGQMFRALSQERHVVDPIEIPRSWKKYAGVDWGYTNPWAVVWGAVDEDGRVWIYREIYKKEVGESEQAQQILAAEMVDVIQPDGTSRREPEGVSIRFADDAMWATRGEAKVIADVYSEEGAHLTKAEKGGRVIGWQRVRSYLSEGPACHYHRAMGWDTCPRLHMFSQVKNLFLELRDLPHATKGDPEDADSDAPDHASDALRYLLLNLGTGPSFLMTDPLPEHGQAAPVQHAGSPFAMRPRDDMYSDADLPPLPRDDSWIVV